MKFRIINRTDGKFEIENLFTSGSGSGTVTSITADAPLTGGTITVSGNIGITKADTLTDGYLSSADWNTFNNKQPAGSYATTALDNLASTAINTDLLLGTSDTGGLGSPTKMWSDLFLASGGIVNWNNGEYREYPTTEAAGVLKYLTADASAATTLGIGVENGFALIKRAGVGAGFYLKDTTAATVNSTWGIAMNSSFELTFSTLNNFSLIADVLRVQRTGTVFFTNNIAMPATKQFYLDGGSNTYLTESSADNIQFVTGGSARLNLSTTSLSPTVRILCAAGTTTLAPLKMQSGTNLTTAEAGAFEYDGTNLLFTKTGTTRGNVLVATAVTTESVASDTTLTITYNGTTYKLLAAA